MSTTRGTDENSRSEKGRKGKDQVTWQRSGCSYTVGISSQASYGLDHANDLIIRDHMVPRQWVK